MELVSRFHYLQSCEAILYLPYCTGTCILPYGNVSYLYLTRASWELSQEPP